MRNPLQSALDDAFNALEQDVGVSFTFSSATFTAWPTEQPQTEAGRTLGSPDQLHWYESKASTAFKVGQVITGSDGVSYTVSRRYQTDPFTGTFKFAILPGRGT